MENQITKDQFLLEFLRLFWRDLGTPERWFTDNPLDMLSFIEECAKNKLPKFISVQPEKNKAQPLGIEKLFFDFDYCKKSEKLTETETRQRKGELKDEVKHFLEQLDFLNIKPLVIKTRRGYHVHVFFYSIYEINNELEFSKQVYKQLQYGILQDHNYIFLEIDADGIAFISAEQILPYPSKGFIIVPRLYPPLL